MVGVALAQAVLGWFAKQALDEVLAVQCRSAHVLNTAHVGNSLIVQVATSAPISPPVFVSKRGMLSPLKGVAGPTISSPAFPYGGAVRLFMEQGYISELEILAIGITEFPTGTFQFALSGGPRKGSEHAG